MIANELGQFIHDQNQRWFEAELLVGKVLGQERTWIALHPDEPVTTKQITTIRKLSKRRLAHEPIAYLLGEAPFYGRIFTVNKSVLIPRPESERLIEIGKELISNGQDWAVWDVGTGSGCLGLSFSLVCPQATVLVSDRSKRALTVAKQNANRLRCLNVTFLNGSLLAKPIDHWLKEHTNKRWLIVANLPYLPLADRPTMQKQVVDHEPNQALFADDDGLALIKRLLQQLKKRLVTRTGDAILLEHDPRQARSLVSYTQTIFPQAAVSTELDQNNAKRFTKIVL